MLKWAVNGSARATLPTRADCWQQEPQIPSSTPLHTPAMRYTNNTGGAPHSCPKLCADISDLSRITAVEILQCTPPQATSKTPTKKKVSKANYATTLPTFDVEYSPSSLVPGPVLALRGIQIPDAYFEKPRYLQDYQLPEMPPLTAAERSAQVPTKYNHTRCSTDMGDLTLERMIDAILENSCKDAFPPPQRHQQRQQHHAHGATRKTSMSPTYTRAEDPASDLLDDGYLLHSCGTTVNGGLYREREVCSPKLSRVRCYELNNNSSATKINSSFQLKRQRAMRRKSSIAKAKNKLKTKSAQKFLGLARRSKPILALAVERHISPDSGRDSSSSQESTVTAGVADFTVHTSIAALDATKRRLSFSSSNANAAE